MGKRKGFTLIELLVVISIISLLMAMLMPALGQAKHQVRRIVCANNLGQLGKGLLVYLDTYDSKLPNPIASGFGSMLYVVYVPNPTPPPSSIPYNIGVIHRSGIIEDGKVFYCPGNTHWSRLYKDYASPPPWGSLPQDWNRIYNQNQFVRINYTYWPQSRETDPARLVGAATRALQVGRQIQRWKSLFT